MKKIYLILTIVSFVVVGCNTKGKQKENTINDSHSSEISLDWNGTYRGVLPCENCDGILTTITLNDDKTFEFDEFYLGDKNQEDRTEKGEFAFTEDGDKIVLTLKDSSEVIYAVGENRLILSIKDSKDSDIKLTGNELSKVSDEEIEFNNEPVKGLLVLGHEVSSFIPFGSSKSYWVVGVDKQLSNKYYQIIEGKSPYTPVVVELIVKDKGKAKEGFAEDYDSVLEIIKIKSIEPLTLENYLK